MTALPITQPLQKYSSIRSRSATFHRPNRLLSKTKKQNTGSAVAPVVDASVALADVIGAQLSGPLGVIDAMKDRKQTFRESGVELYQQIQPVEVIVDASLMSSLIKEALDWAVKSS
ncbi:MAG: hypothetical protein H7Z77_05645 [Chitinophagaceae bacterium]|nr:hypothetical protein [Polaromonas sp.]